MSATSRPAIVIALLLVLLVLAVFRQVGTHEFLLYDDDAYVTENSIVRSGISAKGVAWAFTTSHFSYWHPLTWLSHMMDVEFYGLEAGAHHRTNVLLHSLNTVLLFLVLLRMTGGMAESGFVAALFAVHPLHVESVAWVAERKDVLSTFFWLLAIGAYHRYVMRPGMGRYGVVFLFFLLGLMAKPMVMTLPLTLLLLDYWPLGRFAAVLSREDAGPDQAAGTEKVGRLFWEKAPLFLLSALSGIVTLLSPGVRISSGTFERLPAGERLANALVSAATYIRKMIWPSSLAVYYPHPEGMIVFRDVGLSALLLGGLSILVVRMARGRPYLAAGWGWYLVTLLPVVGLVQVGGQAMADRYTYVPLIGLFIMISWGVSDLASGWRRRGWILGVTSCALLSAFAVVAWVQTGYWRDSRTLFAHALEVTADNYLAEMNLGVALDRAGEPDEAIRHYRNAIRIRPAYADAHYNLGVSLGRKGEADEAIRQYRKTLEINTNHPDARNNLGEELFKLGRDEEAIRQYREAIRLRPDFALAQSNLGSALGRMGRIDEAIVHFREALRVSPDLAMAHFNLGIALKIKGYSDEAIVHFREALRHRPGDATLRETLDRALHEKRMGEGKP